ncbi:acyltransferase family protein [Pseudoroseomonas wenyumeiae]
MGRITLIFFRWISKTLAGAATSAAGGGQRASLCDILLRAERHGSGSFLDRDPPAHPGAVLGYLVKRGFRLYPLLLFTAAAAALLQLYYFEPHVYSQATGWFNDGYKIDLPSLPAEFLANAQGRSATLNGPAWSIKVEILASAVFPLLYWLSLTPARAMVTAPLLVAAMFLAPGGAMQWHYMNVFLFCFFVGALVPRWGWKVAALLRQMGGWPRVALLAALVLVFMFSRRLLAPTAFAPPLVVVLESLAAGVGVVLLLHGRERAFFHAAPMELLARLSFGIYLLHVVVLSVLGHAVFPSCRSTWGRRRPSASACCSPWRRWASRCWSPGCCMAFWSIRCSSSAVPLPPAWPECRATCS